MSIALFMFLTSLSELNFRGNYLGFALAQDLFRAFVGWSIRQVIFPNAKFFKNCLHPYCRHLKHSQNSSSYFEQRI